MIKSKQGVTMDFDGSRFLSPKSDLRKEVTFCVTVHGFRVQGSAPPLAAKAASLITKVTLSCGVTYEGL